MIKRFLPILMMSAINAYAVGPGFYVGMMAGSATNGSGTPIAQINGSGSTTPVEAKKNQFGTRLFWGYKINPYASFENGVTLFSSINYSATDSTVGTNTCSSPRARVRAMDLVGVGSYPFWNFNVFAKGGVAITNVWLSSALNPSYTSTCGSSSNTLNFRPTASVGASYDISQNWVGDLSWTRIMTYGIVKNVDLYALGFSYHFTDTYCGQFLCD